MNESATARIEEFAGKGWKHTGLSRLAQDLVAEIAAYPATVPDGIAFGDAYALDGDPYDVPMEVGPVEIRDADSVVFTEPAAEFPAAWDATARQIVAQKYFYGDHSQGFRETSALQVVFRVSARIALWAVRKRTFATAEDACRFFIYLSHIQIQQKFAFNSPVYFNVGVDVYGAIQDRENFYFDESEGRVRPCSDSSEPHPMISACYIQSVDDNMPSIMALATSEAMLFKRGSGTGTDLSPLRSSREKLSGGGRPSGPVSYMKMYDSIAGIIKSGGRVRRAAKMQTLKYTHPDIMEFVTCKRDEERKARALITAGYEANFNGQAYSTVAFQNANLSVRVDSDLFRKAESGESFNTIAVTTGADVDSIDAWTFLRTVAECAWDCGDPALQFQDRIDEFHTVPNHGPNTSTNPCCFIGSTLVRTSEGKLPIERIAELDRLGLPLPLAFAFDFDAGLPVLRPILHAWKSGETADLVEVKTDKGLSFRCTPDHRFYLRSGRAVMARDLKPGDRLRKIGRGRMGKDPRTSIETKDGTYYQSRWMYEQVNGPIPVGFEIHHVNDDRWDDRISNFELKEKVSHRSDHTRGSANPRYIEVDDRLMVETWEAIAATPRKTFKVLGSTPTAMRWNTYVKANGLKGKVPLAGTGGRIRGMSWDEFSAWIESRRSLVNDCVESVESIHLDVPVSVFDVEVQGVHNFEVGSIDHRHGIIVANSEFVHIDNSSCNLGSLNAMKFMIFGHSPRFDVAHFRRVSTVAAIAMETMVGAGSYPTEAIALNSHRFRPLGQGYANVGCYVMVSGHPYDSPESRAIVAAITAILTATVYATSALLARRFGPFDGFAADRENMLAVMGKHWGHAYDIDSSTHDESSPDAAADPGLFRAAWESWDEAIELGERHGYRNSQATCIAPTGTIAFMMGCDTLGIEPEIALVRFKALAGRGTLKLVNRSVRLALENLGYPGGLIDSILNHISRYNTIEDVVSNGGHAVAPSGLRSEHLPIFDCSFPPSPVTVDGYEWRPAWGRSIGIDGHVDMMAAATPLVSGAVSKTVNMSVSSTVDDILRVYKDAWRKGCKAIAVYRDGSKGSQPVTTSEVDGKAASDDDVSAELAGLRALKATMQAANVRMHDELAARNHEAANLRRMLGSAAPEPRFRMPVDRDAKIHKFNVSGHEGFIIRGMTESGQLGEVFIEMSKQGSTVAGLMDVVGILISLALQHRVPVAKVVEKMEFQKFNPAGITTNRDIKFCSSIIDYVGRFLGIHHVPGYRERMRPVRSDGATSAEPMGVGAVDDVPATAPVATDRDDSDRAMRSMIADIEDELASNPPPGDGLRALVAQGIKSTAMIAEDINNDPCQNCGSIMVRVQPNCMVCYGCGYVDGGCGG